MNDGIKLDLPIPGKLPWPGDAIMIVASNAGTENRAVMEGVVDATCRLCNADLKADTRTVRSAKEMPERRGRPVMFFCVDCAMKHDRESMDLLVDQRDGQNIEHRKEIA